MIIDCYRFNNNVPTMLSIRQDKISLHNLLKNMPLYLPNFVTLFFHGKLNTSQDKLSNLVCTIINNIIHYSVCPQLSWNSEIVKRTCCLLFIQFSYTRSNYVVTYNDKLTTLFTQIRFDKHIKCSITKFLKIVMVISELV